ARGARAPHGRFVRVAPSTAAPRAAAPCRRARALQPEAQSRRRDRPGRQPCPSYPPSKEQVVEVEADRVLTLPGRDVTRRADREDLLVRAVVSVLDAPDQTLPDLVLHGRGDFEEVRLRTQRSQSGSNTLRVLEVLESQGRAQRLGPVVRDVARPTPPRGARV